MHALQAHTAFDSEPDVAICAHTGQSVVLQRSEHDCMIAAIAMLIGRPYEQILSAAQAIQPDYNPDTDPLAPAVMRRVAYAAGALLVSSICMDWRYPGIIGVLSKTLPGCGHAVFWDGAQLIDPGGQAIYDMEYVQSEAVEYIQRAADIQALVEHDRNLRVS